MTKKILAIFVVLNIILSVVQFNVAAESDLTFYGIDAGCFSYSGSWSKGSQLKGYNETATMYTMTDSASNFATWTPDIEQSGQYTVYFWNVVGTGNAANIFVEVKDKNGTKQITVPHNTGTSGFVTLGNFEFDQGNSGYIKVIDNASGYARVNGIALKQREVLDTTTYSITSGYFSTSGSWAVSSAIMGYDGTPTNYGYGTSPVAIWQPELYFGGVYKVSIYNVLHDTNTTSVTVEVNDKNGLHNFTYNNKGLESDSGFIEVGEFEFPSGNSGYVKVTRTGSGYIRLNCIKYDLYQITETGSYIVPQTGQETPYPDYNTRSIPARQVTIPTAKAGATNIYVQNGATGNGTESSPFGTIAQAQAKVREIKAAGYPVNGINVNLMAGTYALDSTLTLNSSDSGSLASPVIWQPYNNQDVSITTGKVINNNKFSMVSDESILDKIPLNAHGKVYETNLNESGITSVADMNLRSLPPYILTFGDKAGRVSRWPNEGFSYTGSLVDTSSREDSGPRKRGFTYALNNTRPLRWLDEPNAWLNGYWMTPYTIDYSKIADIDTKNLKISGKNYNGLGSYGGARYFAENLLSEIDKQGEWYVDTASNKLYVYPYDGWESQKISFSCNNNTILDISGASNVIFRDIKFEVAGGKGVNIGSTSSNCGIIGGEIVNVSGAGISINGTNNYIRDCDIYNTGAQGIVITGGNQYTLVSGGNYAENNRIHDTGNGGGAKQGVTISGCGNRVSNNHIYNIPTHGINGGGMELTIEYNVIERTNMEMGDTGGIYFLNYGMGYGTKIRYNIVRDSVGLMAIPGFSGEGALGIYLDDMTSGVTVEGNLIYNAKEPGIFGHGGRCLTFNNNILVNNEGSVRLIKTSITKSLDINGQVANNIRSYNNTTINTKYPRAVGALTDEFGEPKYNTVTNNITYNSGPFSISDGVANNGTNSGNYQFSGQPTTNTNDFLDFDYTQILAQNQNFVPLPFDKIGLYTGGARTNTTTVVFDNRAESFELTYPQNGAVNVDPNDTLRWTLGKGGTRQNYIFISDDPEFTHIVNFENVTSMDFDFSLDYGKTYYWRVESVPMLGFQPRWNSNGVFSFTTMSIEDKFNSELNSCKFMLEVASNDDFTYTNKEIFNQKIQDAAILSQTNMKTALTNLISAKQEFINTKSVISKGLATLIYDDYTYDTVGQKPYGLFQRSNSVLDITCQADPVNGSNQSVRFLDGQSYTHYTTRYFDPQSDYIEAGTRVLAKQTNGAFSISLMKTDTYATVSGVVSNNSAKVVFATDGNIYADKAKAHLIGAYKSDTWYNVKIVLKLKESKYDVYIDGVLKAQNIAVDDNRIKSVNQIVFDTSEGSTATAATTGTFYIDNTIVKAPVQEGNNAFLLDLKINGKTISGFEPNRMIYDTELTSDKLANARIDYKTGLNAKVKIYSDGNVRYITVVSQDLKSSNTYILK